MLAREPPGTCAEPPSKYTSVAKNEDGGPPPWTPFFLRRATIIGFFCCFISILVALIALYVYTEREDHSLGVATDGDRYYYLWTYGPTAVFTILTACWTQVEYRAVQLIPWILMRRGLTPSSESIFLDYISAWNVISLYKSLKKKHFLVSLCVSGSLLLHGATVFSTGLFELESVPVSHQTSLAVPKKFSDAGFNSSLGSEITYSACSAYSQYNLTLPFGLHKTFVYTPFYPASSYTTGNTTIPTDRHYKAEIEMIEPFLECQETTATWETGYYKVANSEESTDPDGSHSEEKNTTLLSSPDGCRSKIWPGYVETDLTTYNNTVAIHFYVSGCKGEEPNLEGETYTSPGGEDWRLWVSVSNPTAAKSSSGGHGLRSTWPTPPYRGIMCKPQFNAYRGPVTIWRRPGESAISTEIPRQSLEYSKTFADIPAGRILVSAASSFDLGIHGNRGEFSRDHGFRLMKHINISNEKYWNDMSLLKSGIQDDFSCIMRQTFMDDLLKPQLQNIQGVARLTERRLFVRVLSFGLMAGLLICLVAISIVLLSFFVPVSVCPSDTSSIAGMVTIFAQSPEFMALFDGSDLKTDSQMAETRLGQARYVSLEIEGRSKILSQDGPVSDGNPTEGTNPSPTWWSPLSSTWGMRISVITLPILVIIALEIVQHISTSSRGIAFIGDKSTFIHYIWVYIPALIMFSIRCLFTCVEFGVRVVQPYSFLRGRFASPETTIYENQLRKIAIHGLIDTIRKRQWALAAATASLFLAAITPVAVSGLYTVEASWPTSPIKLIQTSRWNLGSPYAGYQDYLWNPSWFDIYDPSFKNPKLAGMVLQLNLSYPQWTYNNLAFPGFNTTDSLNTQEMGYMNIRIPALRSPLICEKAQVLCKYDHVGHYNNSNQTPYFSFNCGTGDPCYGDSEVIVDLEVDADSRPKLAYFYQGISELRKLPLNCPTHSFIYGKWHENLSSSEAHRYDCNATLEEVDVEVRLQLPYLSIDPDVIPRVVPNTSREIFRTDEYFFPNLVELSDHLLDSGSGYKAVMQAMIQGVNGVPVDKLLDPDTITKRLQTIWGIVTAQLLKSNGREAFQDPLNSSWAVHPATDHAPTYEGVFHDSRSYLVQSQVSTRILDGLLGGMIICALIALFSMRTKRILPNSPCSIASVASFVAGSTFLKMMRDRDLQERDLSQRSFSMGWWRVERDVGSASSVHMSSKSSSSLGDRRDPGQNERAESIVERDEIRHKDSIQPSSNGSSSSGHRDEEADRRRRPRPVESVEGASLRSQFIHLDLGDGRKVEVKNCEARTRFGIDIDGHEPLLDDIG
ncbi:unnamed protein product [Penicillium manginii]